MSFGDAIRVSTNSIGAIVVVLTATVLLMGCIEETELEIDGVVVERTSEVEYPEYEEQDYWIVVEAMNGTRYTIEGEGLWLANNVSDKFNKTVPVEVVTNVDLPKELEAEEKRAEEDNDTFLVICVLSICITASFLIVMIRSWG